MLTFFVIFVLWILCCTAWWSMIFFVLCGVFWLYVLYTKQWTIIWICVFSMLCAFVATEYYDYNQWTHGLSLQKAKIISIEWTVISYGKPWQHVVRSLSGIWLLESSQSMELWSRIYVTASVLSVAEKWKTRYDMSDFKFSYEKWLRMKWYQAVLRAHRIVPFPRIWWRGVLDLQNTLIHRLGILYTGDYIWITEWMLIGSKYHINPKLYKQFIDSGLVHILVASGGNLAFILLIFSFVLFFIPFYIRLVLLWIIWWLYCIICGGDSSIMRAYFMLWFLFLSYMFGKSISPRRSLMFVIIIMLVYNPYVLLFDLGFRLSVAAIVGIIIAARFCDKLYYNEGISGWAFRILQYFVVGICVWLSLLPFLIMQSWSVNLTSLVVNYIVQIILPCIIYVLSISLIAWWRLWNSCTMLVMYWLNAILWCNERAIQHAVLFSGWFTWKCILSLASYTLLYYIYSQPEN